MNRYLIPTVEFTVSRTSPLSVYFNKPRSIVVEIDTVKIGGSDVRPHDEGDYVVTPSEHAVSLNPLAYAIES